MKILIPVLENKGINSEISPHFGHAPFFAIFDSNKKEMKIIENSLNHSHPTLTPVDQLMVYEPDILFVFDIGQRAIDLFGEKGVKLKTGTFKIVKDVIENINNLKDLRDGCGH